MANIEIKNIPGKGRGIITNKPIKEGEVIRISDCIPVTDRDCDSHSVIRSYWFMDKSGRGFLIALDWTSFMNHDDNANVDYRPVNATQIKFVARRNINAGEELTINYGYDPSKHNKDIGIDMEQWNKITRTFDGATGVASAAAPATMGTELSEANVKMMVNKPEFRGVLTKLRKKLEGAPRDTKSAFNVVLEYFDAVANNKTEYFVHHHIPGKSKSGKGGKGTPHWSVVLGDFKYKAIEDSNPERIYGPAQVRKTHLYEDEAKVLAKELNEKEKDRLAAEKKRYDQRMKAKGLR